MFFYHINHKKLLKSDCFLFISTEKVLFFYEKQKKTTNFIKNLDARA